MPEYRLSMLAQLDLIEIADYTVDVWGGERAEGYINGLESCFRRLARTPWIGRPCDKIRRGYRRIEHEKHVIIYRVDEGSIFISRILHNRMLPSRHLLDDV